MIALALKFWREGVIGLLLIALAVMYGIARHNDARADKWQARSKAEASAHEVTKLSLISCNGQIEDNNKRIKDAADRLQSDREKAAADKARSDARWEASRASVAALETAARDKSRPACVASPEALRALEGL